MTSPHSQSPNKKAVAALGSVTEQQEKSDFQSTDSTLKTMAELN